MPTLRYYQDDAVTALFAYFASHGGNPVIAAPTGTGKSVIIAEFLRRAFEWYPRTRVIVATHIKELIAQNAAKLAEWWPNAPIGVYSAGLKQRDIAMPIIFGGVASMVKKPSAFGWRDLLIIDEAHLLSGAESSMYCRLIAELKSINPALRVIGLTATAFRAGLGRITENGIFTDTAYDLTGVGAFNRLIREGYLAPLIPRPTGTELDISGVHISHGDYNERELNAAIDKEEITYRALAEACQLGADRQSWLTFCAGIHHAESAAEILNSLGVPAAASHSKLSGAENDKRLAAFKAGELRALVTNNKLTTGFDHPPVDLINMLRPTTSASLWVQMLGRGTRPYDGRLPAFPAPKTNCLVLDFARNTPRLGPINDPVLPRKKGSKPGVVPIKICPQCGTYNHASARTCDGCGVEFTRETKLVAEAGHAQLIKSDLPVVETLPVQLVTYSLHQKAGSPPSMQVSYACGSRRFREFVCLEHAGFASKRARDWWRARHAEEPPSTTAEALQRQSELRVPRQIHVWTNTKYPEIKGYVYD